MKLNRTSLLLIFGLSVASLANVARAQGMSGMSGGGGSGDILGSDGVDDVFCNAARETADDDEVIRGFGGMDTLCGFGGNDSLHGGADGDLLDGGIGNDGFSPGSGIDIVHGGPGDDRILGATDGDTYHGDGDWDWISYNTDQIQLIVNFTSGAVDGNDNPGTILNVHPDFGGGYDTVTSIERVTGTPHKDFFWGSDNVGDSDSIDDIDESFGGGRGDDVFYGGGGNDFIGADRGNDTIVGGPNSDLLRGAEHNDRFEFFAADFASFAEDIIEDFNVKADCIKLHPGLQVLGPIDTTQDTGGKGKPDSIIHVDADGVAGADGTITAYDVALSESDLGCPDP